MYDIYARVKLFISFILDDFLDFKRTKLFTRTYGFSYRCIVCSAVVKLWKPSTSRPW